MKNRFISLLRWSEKYTKTDMVYLFHGSFWLGMAQLAASLVAFALTVILANLLSPEVFGEYRFLMSGFLILSIFALPGMKSAILESTPKGFFGNLPQAFKSMFNYGVLGATVSLVTAGYYFLHGDTNLAIGFICIAVALPLFDSSSIYLEYLKAVRAFDKVAIYTIITRLVLLAIMSGVLFLYPNYAWLVIALFLFGNILPNLFFHKKTQNEFVLKNTETDPALVTYAKHLTLMGALSLFATQLDKILIWNTIGAEELAIFYIAYAIPQEAVRFLNIIPQLAFPKFATTEISKLKKTLLPKILKYFIFVTTCVAFYILTAPYLFQLLFPQYIEAVPYSQILMLSVLGAAFAPVNTFLVTSKNTKALYTISFIVPTVRIIAAVVLIAMFGIWGAVCALIIESVLRILLLLFSFLIPINPSQ